MKVPRIKLGIAALFLPFVLVSASMLSTAQTNAPAAAAYKVNKIADKTWAIEDDGTNAYLVAGDKQALLIDTGYGRGKLYELVRTLTQLPVSVVDTHGHGDHVGGNFQFDDVYIHPADIASMQRMDNHARRAAGAKPITVHEIKEGYRFDLGGRKLEVIEVPGHTPGSISLLDASHKLLFSGDNPNRIVWMFLKDSNPMETYLETMQKLKARASEYNTVLPGHHGPIEASIIDEQIACAQSILNGSCKSVKYDYQSAAPNTLSCEYKNAFIAFDPDKLHRK